MPIDFTREFAITLGEAAAILPGRPHISTVWRFAMRGVRGVRLDTFVSGGRRFTTRQAVERFVAATTAVANGEPVPHRTQTQRRRDHDRATAMLAKDGI